MQTINLYRGSLLPKPEVLPLWYLSVVILIGVIASGFWMYGSWSQLHNSQKQLALIQKQQGQLQSALEQMQKQIPSVAQEAKMQKVIHELQQKLSNSKSLSQMVKQLEGRQNASFSGIFKDLSSLPKNDFWFTRIHLSRLGIELTGKTYASAKIADLVTRLQLLPHTQNAQFGQLVIERESANKKIASFSLVPPAISVNAMGFTNEAQ